MSQFLLSAAHKSSGKTLVSIGICAALTQQQYRVQAFKKGPDYIDPMWLSRASGKPCYNLDFYTMTAAEIERKYAEFAYSNEVVLIEGNKGLYDGLDLQGSNSNAALAELLKVPVILVLDAQGMTRGIAPLILGYQAFDDKIQIAGVILNKLGGQRHESKLRTVIEYYTSAKVVGAVYRDERLQIKERHLGLMPSNEAPAAEMVIQTIAQAVAAQVDLAQLLQLTATPLTFPPPPLADAVIEASPAVTPVAPVTIGIAKDAAFGFYYPDDLTALTQAGAHLVWIDTLHDDHLPPIDGLFIGGGFPEVKMQELTANTCLRQHILDFIEQGKPVYAECGGLMYLSRSITWQGRTCQMVGALPVAVVMTDKPQGRGYVQLQETGQGLWPPLLAGPDGCSTAIIPAHEFHYSKIDDTANIDKDLIFAYKVLRGTGVNGHFDGIVYKNTLACYSHLRDVTQNHWARRFVAFVRAHQFASSAKPMSITN